MSELSKAQATTEEKQDLSFYLGSVAFDKKMPLSDNPFDPIRTFDQWFQWREGWRHARDKAR